MPLPVLVITIDINNDPVHGDLSDPEVVAIWLVAIKGGKVIKRGK